MLHKVTNSALVENGIVVGTGAKYNSCNPLKRYLIEAFDCQIAELVQKIAPKTISEIGCGEGHVSQILLNSCPDAHIKCTDISDAILDIARANCASSRISFYNRSIYDLSEKVDSAELVVCCEVLEHLENPYQALGQLANVASPYCLMSVPREPIFRTLNFLRGANIQYFGNDPGHVQHWARKSFLEFVSSEFEILEVRSPLPWTVVLGKTRRNVK